MSGLSNEAQRLVDALKLQAPTDADRDRIGHALLTRVETPDSPETSTPASAGVGKVAAPWLVGGSVVVVMAVAAFMALRPAQHPPQARPTPPVMMEVLPVPPQVQMLSPMPVVPPRVKRPMPRVVTPLPAPVDAEVMAPAAPPTSSLSEELQLLVEARQALAHDAPQRVLELTAQHRRQFGEGVLAPEREALERQARCRLDGDCR